MQFLFVLDRVENPASANALLGRRLAGELVGLGHTVQLLELWDGETPPPPAPAGFALHTLPFADERLMNAALENGAKGGTPVPLRLARLAAHPTAVAAAFRQLVLHRPRRTAAARRAMEELDAAHHFDAILCVCAPYRTAFALETARVGAKKLLWQLDPYAANRDYQAPGGYRRELQLLNALHAAYITPTAAGDYAPGAPLAAGAAKVHPLGLPCLVPPQAGAAAPAQKAAHQCVFCGSLYPALREPDFALALFTALNDPDWAVVMAGGGWQRFEPQAARAAATLGPRLVRPGLVPPDQAAALQAGADVLLSLGNATANQLPSKLFEYFATGKPVLHLATRQDDPALPYLARYPRALVLFAAEGPTPAVLARLRAWLGEATAAPPLPFAQVAALYPAFTPAQVAQDFLAAL